MYLDETIPLDFRMPISLRDVVEKINKAYEENDDLEFAVQREDIECVAKQCCINGSITDSQLHAIFKKYGLM